MSAPVSFTYPVYAQSQDIPHEPPKKNFLKRAVSILTYIPLKIAHAVKKSFTLIASFFRKIGETLRIVKPKTHYLPGFPQSGNSCWTASLLSALRAIPSFELTDPLKHPLEKKPLESLDQFEERKKLQSYLHQLLNSKKPTSQQVRAFQELLVHGSQGRLTAGAQEDATDACRILLEDMLQAKKFATKTIHIQQVEKNSPIAEKKSEIQHVTSLNLYIPDKKFQPQAELKLEDLFHIMIEKEKTDSNNGPENVTFKEDIQLNIALDTNGNPLQPAQIPTTLPIFIARQLWNKEEGVTKKNSTAVNISEILEVGIVNHPTAKARFRLRSAIAHYSINNASNAGHYVSYVRSSTDANPKWLKYNDDHVSEFSPDEMFNDLKQNGYNFFYDFVGIQS